jgi:hypothetical protein
VSRLGEFFAETVSSANRAEKRSAENGAALRCRVRLIAKSMAFSGNAKWPSIRQLLDRLFFRGENERQRIRQLMNESFLWGVINFWIDNGLVPVYSSCRARIVVYFAAKTGALSGKALSWLRFLGG